MAKVLKQYTIRKLREPTDKELDKDIEWVCNSLGFISSRDQDKTALKILKALVQASKEGAGMTSEELARIVEPTVGSVIYHLKKLTKAGLVVKMGSAYELRMSSLFTTIDEIRKDIEMTLNGIKKIAIDIDNHIGLEHRPMEARGF
ncbi:MAG: helix-turn-helix domain-containing protein [archaeon]